jgi:hypothetical protein
MSIRSTITLAVALSLAACAKDKNGGGAPAQAGATASAQGDTTTPPSPIATVAQAGPITSAPVVTLSPATTVPVTPEEWEQFDYSAALIPTSAFEKLSLDEVKRIRGIIFGKHGRVFEDSTIQQWVVTRPWYTPDTSFTNARLSDGDRQNLEIVREAEAAKHKQIEIGDMRFYQNHVITEAMLGEHSAKEWEVLEAEVLANHGYVFSTGDEENEDDARNGDLQKYFDERYWYRKDTAFASKDLSAIEKQNLDTIALAIMRQDKRAISPGVMNLFQSTPLTEQMLTNLTLVDLRLIRNEIYARHGRPFKTEWLTWTFKQEPWYKPRADYSDSDLSEIEKANVKLVTKREDELHLALSTTLLQPADLKGLTDEDARKLRNEIYARHGRRFTDPKLQHYFESFAWYKPSKSFSERELNETEKANAILIRRKENGAFVPG